MFDSTEAMHIVVHLDGAEAAVGAFIESVGPVVKAFGWSLFQCCALLVGGQIVAAIIRAVGR